MTLKEFSNEFDVLYNNVSSNAAPGLNEYEKSVFLTKAQEEIIKNYLNPKGNKYGEGFDDSIKRQVDFSNLLDYLEYSSDTSSEVILIASGSSIDARGKTFLLPAKVLYIISEVATISLNNKSVTTQVLPISYEEYLRLMSKPFKEPLRFQSWRLLSHTFDSSGNKVLMTEIIPKSGATIQKYKIRYIRKPQPIILIDLTPYNASINNLSVQSSCELPEFLHHEILDRAVELAKVAYTGNIETTISVNTRNE